MAKELFVGVMIGGALAGTFTAATAGAKTTLKQLGTVAEQLSAKHGRLGDAMARAMTHPARSIGLLRSEYERLGKTLDQVRLKQERLGARLAAGQALKDARTETWGQMKETGAAGLAFGAPVVKSVGVAASFQDQMRDISITGDFNAAQEARLGQTVRDAAIKWNQAQAEIGRGMQVLVAGGIQDAQALQAYAPVMAKAATATRASVDDLGSVVIALRDNLKVGESGFEGALNMLSYAGKRGQFEIRDMAKWLPSLSPSFQALGVTGKEAVAEIGAALQIARKGAGSNDEAANNFRNFLQKITSPDTLKDFQKAGIDLQGSLMNLRAQGFTPVQAMLEVITQYMGSKGPAAAGDLQRALAIKDDTERQAALQRLSEAYKLGELFQDMQAMAFIRPAIANMAEMKDIKQGAMGAADKDLLGEDFKKRMGSATEQFKAFKINLLDIGITVGDALLPPINDVLQVIKPIVSSFGAWAKEHPGLIRGVVGLVAGMLAVKMGVLGVAWGFNFLVASPLNAVSTGITMVSAKWTLLRAAWQAGRFAPAIAGLRSIGGGILAVGRFLLPFGQGLLMTFSGPLMLLGKGILYLGSLLAGRLVTALRVAGQAVLWLGRALMLNPIGLLVTAIGVAAYLVWKNWDKVKAATLAGWNWLNGLKDRFFSAGVDLVNGLVGGVTSKLSAARDRIVAFGNSIKGWFSSTLGIKSPSRVFMGFGDNIAEGAAIGIERSAARTAQAVVGMALAAGHAWALPPLKPPTVTGGQAVQSASQPGSVASRAAQALADADDATPQAHGGRRSGSLAMRENSGHGGITVHFNPSITVQGGSSAEVKGAVMEATQLSMVELERMIRRVVAQQQRREN